jgi:hypothetical protein
MCVYLNVVCDARENPTARTLSLSMGKKVHTPEHALKDVLGIDLNTVIITTICAHSLFTHEINLNDHTHEDVHTETHRSELTERDERSTFRG